jgi:hypothetical protein
VLPADGSLQMYLALRGGAASDPVFLLGNFAASWALVMWIWADARRLRRIPCFDFAFLVGVFFPISLVWYAYWSRGARGMLTLLAVAALWMGPVLATAVVSIVLQLPHVLKV